jgi:D-tyrosyl-tRNA(Tyr) deacylase
MRAVVQRVTSASVEVDGEIVGKIGPGLLCLVGLRDTDTDKDADYIARKILGLRLWPSPDGSKAWDQNVQQRGYGVLCVSQFTLFGRLKGAGKPDYSKAMPPQQAHEAYAAFLDRLRQSYEPDRIQDGVFGAMMQVGGGLGNLDGAESGSLGCPVSLVNDGPVTFLLDSAGKLSVDEGQLQHALCCFDAAIPICFDAAIPIGCPCAQTPLGSLCTTDPNNQALGSSSSIAGSMSSLDAP